MKLLGIVTCTFMFLLGCTPSKTALPKSPLKFAWSENERFQVEESIDKKGSKLTVMFDCQISATNNAYILNWLDAKVLKVNGRPVGTSEAWQKEVAPVEAMFHYAPLHISKTGEFIEAMNVEEMIKKLNILLDQSNPNRPAEVRDYYEKLATSESGKAMTDRALGKIWETWVQAWVDVSVSDGEVVSNEGMLPFNNRELPAKETLSNLGIAGSNADLLSLKYEQKLTSTNLSADMKGMLDKLAKETELKEGDPLPKNILWELTTILETHIERKSLKPHWARRTVVMTVSAPGETNQTSLEVNEYRFFWKNKAASSSVK